MRKYHHRDIRRLIAHGISTSTTPPAMVNPDSPYHWRWNMAADCAAPYITSMYPTFNVDKSDPDYKPYQLDIFVRCRKCEACQKHRKALWWCRAQTETLQASRTWFSTLTFRPDIQARIRARAQLLSGDVVYETRLPEERFALMVKSSGQYLTKFLKRVRKNSGANLRYLLVPEPHKSGLPHYHALIHEYGDRPVKWVELDRAWQDGHSQFKLAAPEAVGYVTKYITKTLGARVRASKGYGNSMAMDR